jgi:hypothetical protein
MVVGKEGLEPSIALQWLPQVRGLPVAPQITGTLVFFVDNLQYGTQGVRTEPHLKVPQIL